jgi:hypothetical protein
MEIWSTDETIPMQLLRNNQKQAKPVYRVGILKSNKAYLHNQTALSYPSFDFICDKKNVGHKYVRQR